MHATAFAAENPVEYSTSPADRIICTIRTQNVDGITSAAGTDFSSGDNIYMETIALSSGGLGARSWMLDRHAAEIVWVDGGYPVFKKHCAPILEMLSDELKAEFDPFFAD
jgi:hypothetical protein